MVLDGPGAEVFPLAERPQVSAGDAGDSVGHAVGVLGRSSDIVFLLAEVFGASGLKGNSAARAVDCAFSGGGVLFADDCVAGITPGRSASPENEKHHSGGALDAASHLADRLCLGVAFAWRNSRNAGR